MFDKIINKLVSNLDKPKVPQKINVVLSGGAFSGSYSIGVLLYLKFLEKNGFIIVDKISGCSIGAALAILFKINKLKYSTIFYELQRESFKTNLNLSISYKIGHFIKKLLDDIDVDFYKQLDGNFFISYHNIKNTKHNARSSFKSNKHLCDCIIRSCFIPFILDTKLAYKDKYIDGFYPHFFNHDPDHKNLFINLTNFGPFEGLCITNENNNISRIMYGVYDAHLFFSKKQNTKMCSFMEEWTPIETMLIYLKRCFFFFFVHVLSFFHIYGIPISQFTMFNNFAFSSFKYIVRNFLV